jgi:pSer/pThr/pTyr-binding forkhead associated (FHA) protein
MGITLSARHIGDGEDSQPFFEKAFKQSRITIGNHSTSNLRLNGSVVAAEQVVIIDGMVEPIIINCADGTSLNGEPLAADERRSLRDGDQLHIGTYLIQVSVNEELPVQRAAAAYASGNGNGGAQAHIPHIPVVTESNKHTTTTFSPDSPAPSATAQVTEELSDPFLPESDRRAPAKTFAAILDGLRTDEDRFYFLVEGGQQSGMRVPIETEEMPLGWHVNGEYLTFDVSAISNLLAVVRKDWSGVILQTQTVGAAAVNDEPVEDMRRLRDGDRITFPPKERKVDHSSAPILIFREPASLVILDSLMPRSLPHQTDPSHLTPGNGDVGTTGTGRNLAERLAALLGDKKEYFGAFTVVELSLMALGTFVGAAVIFLILNYS